MRTRLVRNAIQTPDGTVLVSRSRHDFREYTDSNGKQYMVDGGLDYIRTTIHDDQLDLAVYLEDGHNAVRDAAEWGTFGQRGNQPLRYVKIKHMDTDHLKAVLDTVHQLHPNLRTAMEDELNYRELLHDD